MQVKLSPDISLHRFSYLRASLHEIGYWLLVIGDWLLVTGYWLLVIGYWILALRTLRPCRRT